MTLSTVRAVLRLLAAELGAEVEVSAAEKEQIKASLDKIYQYAKRNDMAHLVGHALVKNKLICEEDPSFALFEAEQFTAFIRQERQDFELARICAALEDAGIDFIPLKGAVMRGLYPEPWMRTSCDVDVLVKTEDLAAARECMINALGYKQGKTSLHDESFELSGGIRVELHFELMEEGSAEKSSKVMLDVWSHTENAQGKKHHKLMSDEMFYFYHIAHTAKHFEDGGIGTRPFLDLYLLTRDRQNEERRAALLHKGGLEAFERVARALSSCWFEGEELDILGQRAENFVLRCGAYGSKSNAILLAKEKAGGGRGYILSRIFMPYDSIKCSYPILKKHKWLLPFCQIARWFKLISPGRARSAAREIKTTYNLSEKEFRALKALMTDVGLK